MSYEYGDFVVYDPGYKQEVGRVTTCREGGAFVCYHQGCTAAYTPDKYLRPATPDEIAGANIGIGFHRFDETCPERDEDACYGCKAARA